MLARRTHRHRRSPTPPLGQRSPEDVHLRRILGWMAIALIAVIGFELISPERFAVGVIFIAVALTGSLLLRTQTQLAALAPQPARINDDTP